MVLQLNDITKSFGEKQVLKGVNGTFEKGKIYGLLGRNGAGKTTLFNCISEEIAADSGTITLNGEVLTQQQVGYVFSTPILPEFLTGYEFIRFFTDINRQNVPAGYTPDYYFDLVKMDHADRHRLIKGYSHGMKNKLQMLTFMIAKPPVVLLDEPLTSFDVVVALEMKNLLRQMKQEHILIFSTHILQLATDLCDEIAVLTDGQLKLLDNSLLKDPGFEQTVIDLLKGDSDV